MDPAATPASQVIGSSGGSPVTLTFNGGPIASTFAGTIQDVLGGGAGSVALTVAGGTLNLAGVNTYSGNTSINSGNLVLGSPTSIPSGAGKGNVAVGGTLDLGGIPLTVNGLSGAGTVTSGQPGAVTFTVGANDQTSTFSGSIANGAGTVAVTKIGAGLLNLAGNSTYSGGTTISSGTLQIGAANPLPYGAGVGNVSLSGGAVLDLAGNALAINGLSGSGIVRQHGPCRHPDRRQQ